MSSARVLLPPGEQAEVTIVIQPLRRSESRAGDYPFSVVVTSSETGREVVTSGQVTVLPFESTEIALKPVRSRRRLSAHRGEPRQFRRHVRPRRQGRRRDLRLRIRSTRNPPPARRASFACACARRAQALRPAADPGPITASPVSPPTTRRRASAPMASFTSSGRCRHRRMPAILTMLLFMTFGSLLVYWRWPHTPTSAFYARNIVLDVRELVGGGEKKASAANPEDRYAGVHMCDKKDATKQPAFSGPAAAPYFSQRDPAWADTIYARSDDKQGFPRPTAAPISTSAAAASFSIACHGALQVLTMPDGQPLNPKTVNEWFNSRRETSRGWVSTGYVYGDVVWSAVNQLSAEIASAHPGSRTIRFAGVGTGKEDEVRQRTQGRPLRHPRTPGHYVAATGVDGDTILINDPYYPDRPSATSTTRTRSSPPSCSNPPPTSPASPSRCPRTCACASAPGKVVGTLKTVAPTKEAAADAQVGIKGATSASSTPGATPPASKAHRPPRPARTRSRSRRPRPVQEIEVTDPRGEKTSVAIHTYDRLGQVALRSEDGQGQLVIQMSYDPTKRAPEFAVTEHVPPGGGGATGSATPSGATPSGSAPAGNTGGAGAGGTGGGTPAGANPGHPRQRHSPSPVAAPRARPAEAPRRSPCPRPRPRARRTTSPSSVRPPTCSPKNATVACNAAIDGPMTSQNWTINGVPAPSGQNRTHSRFRSRRTRPWPWCARRATSRPANRPPAKSRCSSRRRARPPSRARLQRRRRQRPRRRSATRASSAMSPTDPYDLKRRLIPCETTFVGQFTAVVWNAPKATAVGTPA